FSFQIRCWSEGYRIAGSIRQRLRGRVLQFIALVSFLVLTDIGDSVFRQRLTGKHHELFINLGCHDGRLARPGIRARREELRFRKAPRAAATPPAASPPASPIAASVADVPVWFLPVPTCLAGFPVRLLTFAPYFAGFPVWLLPVPAPFANLPARL